MTLAIKILLIGGAMKFKCVHTRAETDSEFTIQTC